MFNLFCVTNRSLCKEDFLARIRRLSEQRPAGIILREKDLQESEYQKLAEQVLEICKENQTPCILHHFVNAAKNLNCPSLHLPLPILRELPEKERALFHTLGSSCHSEEEAMEAERLGCTYLIAGHIFDTDCKKGLPGRGLSFLRKVCDSVSIPVYAIGGIRPENLDAIQEAGARGACIMSACMTCENGSEYLSSFMEYKNEV